MSSIIYNRAEKTAALVRDDGEELVVAIGEEDEASVTFFGPPPVPQSVSPADFRIALDQMGLLDEVEAYVATLPKAAQIKWQWAVSIDRDNSLFAATAQSQNWSVAQIDEVFRLAAAASM